MINQHQFQQAAKHYRSGRISISEFYSRVSAGSEAAEKDSRNCVIQRGDPDEILGDILDQLKASSQPVLVTGVCDALGEQLSDQITEGTFDSTSQTFACDNGESQNVPNANLAVITVVNVDANFKTGYLAAMVAAARQ